jgi:uncharacterized membrane protein YkvA (DUF1232 family)
MSAFSRWFGREVPRPGPEPQPAPAPAPEPAIRPEEYVGTDKTKNEQVVREGFVAKAKQYLRHIPMASEVVALYFCLLDPKTPLWVKGTAAAALAYFILPLDAIPDILPIVGLSDDVTVLTAAITALSAHITAEHRKKAEEWLREERIATA